MNEFAEKLKKRARQVRNLAIATRKRWSVPKENRDRTDEEAAVLHKICESCPSGKYDAKLDECTICECKMKVKTFWKTEHCKLNHWGEGMVSVIIPARNEKLLQECVKQIRQSAVGSIEILVTRDDGVTPKGNRWARNESVKNAVGDYLFFVDGHCHLSPGWDLALKENCQKNTLAQCVIGAMDEEFKIYEKQIYHKVILNSDFIEKWGERNADEVEESMTITGCGYMIRRDQFLSLGGFDETLSVYGSDGPEMATKVWLSGGRCVVHSGVICWHIFQPSWQTQYCSRSEMSRTRTELKRRAEAMELPGQIHPLDWLYNKFEVKYAE